MNRRRHLLGRRLAWSHPNWMEEIHAQQRRATATVVIVVGWVVVFAAIFLFS